jgi:ubiquinone/menaquinone biosynthesis C-methylase UbiE
MGAPGGDTYACRMGRRRVDVSRVDAVRQVAVDHHDQAVEVFERYYGDMSADRFANAFTYGRSKIDAMLDAELDRLAPGGRCLDVGCGTGVQLEHYRSRGFTVAGAEPAPAMREAAADRNPGADIRDAIATNLPFADASFEFVSAIEVLRYLHLHDIRRSLAEFQRVLVPGGTVFLTMVNRWALDGFYLLQRTRQLARRRRYDDAHPHCEFFTPASLRAELEAAGFVKPRIDGRLLAPVRLAYKLPGVAGPRVARAIERSDDRIHRSRRLAGVAGHLIAAAETPATR